MQVVRLVSSGDLEDHPTLFSSANESSINMEFMFVIRPTFSSFSPKIIISLNKLLASDLEKATLIDYQIKEGYGVGACEAPRGTLYHSYQIDKNGSIKKCNIITPTAQNLTSIEESANLLLENTKNLDKKKSWRKIK